MFGDNFVSTISRVGRLYTGEGLGSIGSKALLTSAIALSNAWKRLRD
jgi:hypothetical protein